jgi:chromosome segregation ATPase
MSDALPVTVVTEGAAEANAEAAVAIAEVEAETTVAVAEIAAETRIAEVEAATAADDEDVQWLRAELATLREQCATNAGALSSLEVSLVALSAQMGELTAAMATLSTQATLSAEQMAEAERLRTASGEGAPADPTNEAVDGPRDANADQGAATQEAVRRRRLRYL